MATLNAMRFVIIGTGNISTTWINAAANTNDAEIVACVSRSGRRPAALPSLPCAPDLASVGQDFDAAIVLVPNGLHHEGIVAAARLGKHVLSEKPLDVSRAHMDLAIRACSDAHVQLAVAFQHRTAPDNQALKRLLDEGVLGRLQAVHLGCSFWRPQSYYDSSPYRGSWAVDGGGVLMQQAMHQIDLYQWLFGLPTTIKAELGTVAHSMEAEDHAVATFRHQDGLIGSLVASTAWQPGYPARLDVLCERGSLSLTGDHITSWNVAGVPNPAQDPNPIADIAAPAAQVVDTSQHEALLRDFITAIAYGRPPLVDGSSARLSTDFALRIYEAAGWMPSK